MLLLLNLLLSFAGLAISQDRSLSSVKQAFEAASIPSDLFINFNPKALLEVTFPQPSGNSITLSAGVQVPRNATVGPPTFSAVGDIGIGPFVIATVDPDAPTPQDPTNAQIRHFLGPNFFPPQGTISRNQALMNRTPALTEFHQPTPPAGSDAHRYIFLMFNQPEFFNAQRLVTSTTPTNLFNISEFAAATGLGDPIAGTFMRVAPDPTAV